MTGRRVLVVGGGGREHALAATLARSPCVARVQVAPGNAGTPDRVALSGDDVDGVVSFAAGEGVDLVVVGPEAPLAAGLVDALLAKGIPAFGPTRAAAELEWSKAFARDFCARHGIPGPRYAVFRDGEKAAAWARAASFPVVVKAAGLAAGKGVFLPESGAEAEATIRAVLSGTLGEAGDEIVLEERLHGPEVSLLAFTDGTTIRAMPPAQDHKRVGEGDTGPNTGGMGAYAPAPVCGPELVDALTRDVLVPTVAGMAAEGRPYTGVLYAGLMLCADGPRVLEFNCRFGDPETQAILPLLESDLLDILEACCTGTLAAVDVNWSAGAAACVVLAAPGYPGAYPTGAPITGLDDVPPGVHVFHGGTEARGDRVVAAGGRVLGITGTGPDLPAALAAAYAGVEKIDFDGRHFRRDIGRNATVAPTYAAAGVNLAASARAVALLRPAVEATHGPEVLAGVGAFGGAYLATAVAALDEPVLVASTDGVGTKVLLALATGRYAGLGVDIVNHCVNDVLVQGARPLFFLDYIAAGRLDPDVVAAIVGGMATACQAAGCALLGGETAEMPGVYAPSGLDVAGTLVGVVERREMLPRLPTIVAGDVLLGLASSGPHTNGYSLLRAAFEGISLDATPAPLRVPLGDALLAQHRSYLPVLAPVLTANRPLVKALVHVTGGGFIENIPRALPPGLGAVVRRGTWPVPALFDLAITRSGVQPEEAYRVLNMGIGMIAVCARADLADVTATFTEEAWVIGELVPGAGVRLA